MPRLFAVVLLVFGATSATAQHQLTRITERDVFVERLAGQDLTRTGITVRLTPDGGIEGRAFGAEVAGSWHWEDGYFCREMSWTTRSWPMNCQAVYLGAGTVRFVADHGQGEAADLTVH